MAQGVTSHLNRSVVAVTPVDLSLRVSIKWTLQEWSGRLLHSETVNGKKEDL